jgi:hypothetical protein
MYDGVPTTDENAATYRILHERTDDGIVCYSIFKGDRKVNWIYVSNDEDLVRERHVFRDAFGASDSIEDVKKELRTLENKYADLGYELNRAEGKLDKIDDILGCDPSDVCGDIERKIREVLHPWDTHSC